jgi:arginyl-tRNA synthetase
MNIDTTLQNHIATALKAILGLENPEIILQSTQKNFAGSHTLVTFGYAKSLKLNPEEVGQKIGDYLKNHTQVIAHFNVVKGFLNLEIADAVWLQVFNHSVQDALFGKLPKNNRRVMVEYSSPNTNKPLHLGHLRNIFLGWSLAQILEANGYEVFRTKLVNDRGIHICKSMLAYQRFGKGETPESSDTKGDHLIGRYYVEFDKVLKVETAQLMECVEKGDLTQFSAQVQTQIGITQTKITQAQAKNDDKRTKDLQGELKEIVQNQTSVMQEAKQILQKWEAGDVETLALWQKMNGWVYAGFDETYREIGVRFDKIYYESQTYLLGKDVIEDGLAKGIFYKKEDGSVWIDLTADKLDQKLVLRSDGTSVYITQDLGTADLKHADFNLDKSVYVIGNEQDYHCKVLFKILEKLGKIYAGGLYHLSYGMVELPTGKMKSREGTVVDADEIVAEMLDIAEQRTKERGQIEGMTETELQDLYRKIGLGALKYFLLKVDPKQKILFNPDESVRFEGDAMPFIQYNHARIRSILSKAEQMNVSYKAENYQAYQVLHPSEVQLVQLLVSYPDKIREAGETYMPSVIAQYSYEVAKAYSKFFSDCSIFLADTEFAKSFRVALSAQTARVLKLALDLLGIEVPERM